MAGLPCVRYLKGLADPTRMEVVRLLLAQPRCVTDLAELLGTSVASTSYHLKSLRNAGIVSEDRQGQHVFYQIAPAISDASDPQAGKLNLGCCQVVFPGAPVAAYAAAQADTSPSGEACPWIPAAAPAPGPPAAGVCIRPCGKRCLRAGEAAVQSPPSPSSTGPIPTAGLAKPRRRPRR